MSEEGPQSHWDTRRHWESFWLIDPLDGTRDFVDRTNDFTINVALIHRGHAVVGFVDIPVQGITYLGIADQGAYRIENETAEPIATRTQIPPESLRCAVSRAHSSKEATWIQEHGLVVEEWIRAGSALKFALVAEGLADLYPRLGPTMEWDTAAGHCLVVAAGGDVRQLDGRPLQYNRENLKNTPFVARGWTGSL